MRQCNNTRLAILVNIIAPYRIPIYGYLGRCFDMSIICSGKEDNRRWSRDVQLPDVTITEAWGLTLKRRYRRSDGSTEDVRYIHLNPGYATQLMRLRPDAVISSEMGFRSIIGVVYGLIFRNPIWIWWGGTIHTERHTNRVKRFFRRNLFARFVSHWISYGTSSTTYLQSIGVKSENILQIQNSVEEQSYRNQRTPYHLDVPHPRALYVGHMIGLKGIHPLLKATERVQRQIPNLSLVVVGDGPEACRFEQEVFRRGIQNVHRIPYLAPEHMSSVYLACDFLVFPTLQDVWGLVVNEALLSGLPVIASSYAGCAQELLPEENVFDPLDEESFHDAYLRAARGQLALPDTSRLKPILEVAEMIACDITKHVRIQTQESPPS